ncbi:MAG TPA: cupin domain-containing protein [candidate division Zixibacteria bacterium]|nr:cupin domain-containing protein [candidate division Zixibacteria bacterium]
MKIIKNSDSTAFDNHHGVDVRKLYDTKHAMASHMTISPGQSLKRHTTPVDVFFYVLEGEGVVEVGDERETVGADTIIDSPADIPHCWFNESTAPLRILIVKVPRPTKPSKFE